MPAGSANQPEQREAGEQQKKSVYSDNCHYYGFRFFVVGMRGARAARNPAIVRSPVRSRSNSATV